MPRSQRTQLNKKPIAEAKLGTIESEPVRTVNMPLVTAKKSLGQSLEEALGLVSKAGADLFQIESDKRNKATQAEHKIQGNNDGKTRAMQDLAEIRKLPITEQNTAIMGKAQVYFKALKEGGFSLSTEYFSSNVSAYRDAMDSADGKIRTLMNKEVQAVNKTNAANSIITMFEGGKSAGDIITTNKDGPWTGTSAQKLDLYVDQAASYVLAMQQTVPGFDVEDFIKNYLEIKAPNNGPDLLKNASTGDKIRKLRADLTSEGNTVYTKYKKEWKEKTSLLDTQGVTPTDYNAHVDTGVNTGVYTKTKAKDLKLKYYDKTTKELLTKNIKALNEKEQALVATLKTDATYGTTEGKIYVSKDVKGILVSYEKNLNKQVNANDMTLEEATEKMETMTALVLKKQKHLTYQGNFELRGDDNASDYETLPSETKTWVTEQVKESLKNASNLEQTIAISTSNPGAAKSIVATMFPYTTNVSKVNDALKIYDDLKNYADGDDFFNMLPTKQKVYYESLDAIRDLDGIISVSEAEADRLTQMIEAVGDTRDFRAKVRQKHKGVQNLKESISNLPDSLQSEMLVIYDYFTQFMDPKDAVSRLETKVRPKYYKVWDRPGTGILGSDVKSDSITAINWGAFKYNKKVSPVLISKAFSARGQHVEGDIRIAYDEKTNMFTIGKGKLTDSGLTQVDMYKATYAELTLATSK
jgi:hypothetical protein